jgi:polyhydroxybutyrate depolymerase
VSVAAAAVLVATTLIGVGAGDAPAATGCGAGGAPGTTQLTVTAGGRARTVLVHVPRGYSGQVADALVLNLHGSGSTAASQEAFSGMDRQADTDGFLVAYPQAAIPAATLPGSTGFDWNVPRLPLAGGRAVSKTAANDETFLRDTISQLEQRYCVDQTRVDVTGFSGGARMASQVGCDLPTLIAAIAPVSGLRFPSPCRASRAVPVLAFHGTGDPVDPYNGHGQVYWTYSVPEAARRWAAHDHCVATGRGAPAAASIPGAVVTAYGRCANGATVTLATIAGAGHTWPGGPPVSAALRRVLGPQSNVDANAPISAFFRAHPLP